MHVIAEEARESYRCAPDASSAAAGALLACHGCQHCPGRCRDRHPPMRSLLCHLLWIHGEVAVFEGEVNGISKH